MLVRLQTYSYSYTVKSYTVEFQRPVWIFSHHLCEICGENASEIHMPAFTFTRHDRQGCSAP